MMESKILLVDDSLTQRKIQKKILQSSGFSNISDAANGKQALELLAEGDIDLMLLDWNMPEMDGMEVLGKVRQDANLSALKIIMATSNSEDESQAEAMAEGADGFIGKPFSEEAILTKIKAVLGA